PRRLRRDRLGELAAAVDAAGAEEALLLLVPALAGDRLAGEVKDGVAAGDLVAPGPRLRRIGAHRVAAGPGLAATADAHDLVAAGDKRPAQGPSDEAAGAGQEDSHRRDYTRVRAPRPGASSAASLPPR